MKHGERPEDPAMTPDEMAEAFERARYEQLRGALWSELRDGERTARVEVARRALQDAGITRRLKALRATADEARLHRVMLTERDTEVARLEAELAELQVRLDDALAVGREAQERAEIADAVIESVRTALGDASATGPGPAAPDVATAAPDDGPEHAPAGRSGPSRFARLARSGTARS